MPKLAANLSMLFTEHPFLDRFARAAEAGFAGVEFLFPYEEDAEDIVERLEGHRADLVCPPRNVTPRHRPHPQRAPV